jgi:hypothetical protein
MGRSGAACLDVLVLSIDVEPKPPQLIGCPRETTLKDRDPELALAAYQSPDVGLADLHVLSTTNVSVGKTTE